MGIRLPPNLEAKCLSLATGARHAPAPLLDLMTERDLQAEVERIFERNGFTIYHTHDSRRSEAGFPDLVAIRVQPKPRLVVAELKRAGRKPTAAQRKWLALFAAVGAEVYVWHPSDLREIERILA